MKLVDFHITNLSKRIDNEVDPQIVTEMDTTVAASFGIIPRACKLGLVLFSLLTIYDLHLVAAFDYKVYTVVLK